MVVGKGFNLRPQNGLPWFVPIEVLHEVIQASQTSPVHLSMDVKTSSRCSTFTSSDLIHRASSNPGSVRVNINRQPGEVTILGLHRGVGMILGFGDGGSLGLAPTS
jgi:hypothetical protein